MREFFNAGGVTRVESIEQFVPGSDRGIEKQVGNADNAVESEALDVTIDGFVIEKRAPGGSRQLVVLDRNRRTGSENLANTAIEVFE